MAAKLKSASLEESLHYLPTKMREKLMIFQKEGIFFGIQKHGSVLVGDEMGLGKTLQALAIAYYFRSEWPLLIVVPSSLRYPWIDEIEKWMPEIDPHDISLIQSGTDIHCIGKAQISVVTYGLLRCPSSLLLQEALYNQDFQVIILDESHNMKNRKSATSKYLVPLVKRAKRKMLLTGTPALARPSELFPQLDALVPGMFGSWSDYSKRYCDAHWQYFGRSRKQWNTDGASNLVELQQRLVGNVMIRRLKQDVLTQLPPKQRQRIPFEIKSSDLKKDLDQTMNELNALLNKNQANMGQMLDRVSQAGQDERGVSSFHVKGLVSELYRKTSKVKIGPVKEYVKMLCANAGLKFLIFGYHHVMMDAISEQLQDEKITYIRIDGHTPQEDRPRLVKQFQADPNTRVAVLSTKAAGVGLTLTAATLVVFSELDWTPGVLQQCEDRAHRIGQQDTVHVHYLVARGTLDEWVWSALARKTTVISTTLNGKRQLLRMGDADRKHTDVLSKAEAYKIPENGDQQELSKFFKSTPLPRKQRSLKDFFTPKSRKRTASGQLVESSPQKSSLSKSVPHKRAKQDISGASATSDHENEVIAVVESGDESTEDFKSPKMKFNCRPPESTNDLEDDIPASLQTTPSAEHVVEPAAEENILPSIPQVQCKRHKSIKNMMTNSVKSPCEEKRKKVDEEVEHKWSCSTCTFLNHPAVRMCEMCTSPKAPKQRKSVIAALCSSQKDIWDVLSSQTSSQNADPSSSQPLDAMSMNEASSPDGETSVGCHGNRDTEDPASCRDVESSASRSHDAKNSTLLQHLDAAEDVDKGEVNGAGNATSSMTFMHQSQSSKPGDGDSRIHSPTSYKSSHPSNFPSDDDDDDIDETGVSVLDTQVVDDVVGFLNDNVSVSNKCSPQTPRSVKVTKNKQRTSFCVTPDKPSSLHLTFDKGDAISTIHGSESEPSVTSSPLPGLSMSQPSVGGSDLITDISASDTFSMEVDSDLELDELSTYDESDKENSEKQDTTITSEPCQNNTGDCDRSEKSITFIDGELDVERELCSQNSAEVTLNKECAHDTNQAAGSSTADVGIAKLIAEETAAANTIFRSPSKCSGGETWWCENCKTANQPDDEDCDGCFKPRPPQQESPPSQGSGEVREVNLDEIPVYSLFSYRCSANTSRIYLYNQEGEALHLNFVPLDVELNNYASLPDILIHPQNLKLVQRFIREWKSLTETKQRVVIKSDEIFTSPIFLYDTLKSGRKPSTQRFTTKADGAATAVSKAEEVGGSVRLVTRPEMMKPGRKRNRSKQSAVGEASSSASSLSPSTLDEVDWDRIRGVVQAVNADGVPLCIECHKPYTSHLVSKKTIKQQQWATRFCSHQCAQTYWMKHHGDYLHKEVYDAEHGVCQKCGLDAADFLKKLKHIRDLKKRAAVINESKYNVLSGDIREKMVRAPKRGMFWQVDHITPVALGGGECDLDNLRTLCTVCHREVTANQLRGMAEEKKEQKRMRSAANTMDITSFFQPR